MALDDLPDEVEFPLDDEFYLHYTHRNGESDEPTVDGWYWIEWQPDLMIPVLVWDIVYWKQDEGWEKVVFPSAIYGPIPQPRREQPHAIPDNAQG